MRVLGIDLSLSATGLAAIRTKDEPFELMKGMILCKDLPNGLEFSGRLIKTRTTNVLDRWEEIILPVMDWAQHATHVMIEGYAMGFDPYRMTRTVGIIELGGIVRYHLRKIGKIPIEIAPTSLKKFITNNGHAKKEEILKAIQKEIPSIDDHNLADACGLAQIGCGIYQAGLVLPRHQADVVYRITHPEEKIRKQSKNRILKFSNANDKQKTLGID